MCMNWFVSDVLMFLDLHPQEEVSLILSDVTTSSGGLVPSLGTLLLHPTEFPVMPPITTRPHLKTSPEFSRSSEHVRINTCRLLDVQPAQYLHAF